MGQIVGKISDIYRCNLRAIQSGGTKANTVLAADEVWLVDSTNSLSSAYSGNCDCYIVGDGSTAATSLTLHAIADITLDEYSNQPVANKLLNKIINGQKQNYVSGYYLKTNGRLNSNSSWAYQEDYTPVSYGDTVIFNSGTTNSSACFVMYDSNKAFLGYYGCSSAPRTITLDASALTNIAYVRLSFAIAKKDEAYIRVNGKLVWQPKDNYEGIVPDLSTIKSLLGTTLPVTPTPVSIIFSLGYIDKTDGTIKTSSVNSYSQRIDITGYEKIQFVGNADTASNASDSAAFYDANGTFLSAISYYDATAQSNTYKTYNIDIPTNAKYFAFTLQAQFQQYSQVNLIKTTFEQKINALNERVDLVAKEAEEWEDEYQIYTNEGVGNTCALHKYAAPTFRCLDVPCVAGQKVFITKANGGQSPRMWCFLNSSNVILQVADASASVEALELTAPANTARLICNDTLKTGDVYIYTGEKPLNVKVDLLNEDSGADIQHGRTSNCKDFGTQPAADGTTGSFCDIKNNGYSQLLTDVYEPLRSANPNYITRTNIGKDASGTIDMYAYVFEPRYYQQSVYLQAGIHGKEIDAVACLARIMQLITNATDADEDLMWLRQNVKFTIVPCVNVWGISQSTKNNNNSNNAQLQQWSATTPPTEVANVKAYIEDNALTDELSFMLDMHTTTNDKYYDFYGNIQKHAKNVRTIFRTNAWLCDNYALDGRTVDDQYLGYYEPANYVLFRQWYYYMYGVQTATLELSDYHWDSHLSTSPVITMGVTMWLNYIIQMVNDYYRSKFDIPDADYRESRG